MRPLTSYRLPFPRQFEWSVHFLVYLVVAMLIVVSSQIIVQRNNVSVRAQQDQITLAKALKQQADVGGQYVGLKKLLSDDKAQGVDVSTIESVLPLIAKKMQSGQFTDASKDITFNTAALNTLLAAKNARDAEALAKLGQLTGVVTDGTNPLAGVTVTLLLADKTAASATTDAAGAYSITVDAGTYTISFALSGYVSVSHDGVVIIAQKSVVHSTSISKPVPTPAPAPSTPRPTAAPSTSRHDSTTYSTYDRTTINASSGSFTADIMTFDLSSGHIRVMEDTADDNDCTNNCSVKSVLSFVQQDGGFAGINGSYFCPTAYGDSCAGKTNSFYWKQFNSRVQKMINADNGLGHRDPFLIFDSSGHARFLQFWDDYVGINNIYAGISCTPAVVLNGSYSVDESTLDDKQRTAKISRGAVGLKGQTLYVVTIQGATVQDLGHAMVALGLDNAMNIDAGGSSGMVYKNSYKLGPGRAVPNVLVFIEQ